MKAYTTRVGGGPFPAELTDSSGTRLQERGMEFGTVSKRKRRCGWLDFPMLRFAHRLNGFSSLAITKLDVLSGLKELKIADYYLLNGKKISEFPSLPSEVAMSKPVYKTFAGWQEDISGVKRFTDLPRNCRLYLQAVEKELNIPIKYISVASERSAVIIKNY